MRGWRPSDAATRLALAVAVAVALGGCGAAPGSTEPLAATSPSHVATQADAWHQANVELPSAVMTAPSLPPGYFCDPCHALAEDQLFGVGESPTGFIAVGVQQPPAQAIAFASSDGTDWGSHGTLPPVKTYRQSGGSAGWWHRDRER